MFYANAISAEFERKYFAYPNTIDELINGESTKQSKDTIELVIEYLDEAEKVIKVESDTLEYKVVTPEPQPEPEKPTGGCGKKGVELFVSLMAASAVIGILLRKRK